MSSTTDRSDCSTSRSSHLLQRKKSVNPVDRMLSRPTAGMIATVKKIFEVATRNQSRSRSQPVIIYLKISVKTVHIRPKLHPLLRSCEGQKCTGTFSQTAVRIFVFKPVITTTNLLNCKNPSRIPSYYF
jgi:hypothetical protein